MTRVKAYRVRDFADSAKQPEAPKQVLPNITGLTNIAGLAGVIQDFEAVANALKTFPYKSAMSLAGVLVLLFITFKVGRRFGIIQSSFKGKGT